MNRLVLSFVLILTLITSLTASCTTPEETIPTPPTPSAPDITLTSGYSQTELEAAVSTAGGGCDSGTLTIIDNNNGTYTVECRDGENTVTAIGNIDIVPKTVPPRIQTAPCQFQIPLGQTVECGYLIVPEDRSQPNCPTIKLNFAIFKSPSENPAPDPVVYLEGGPGGHALETMFYTFNEHFAPFLANRDFIVFDQRGTGYSEPSLDCPEVIDFTYNVLDQNLSPEEGMAMANEELMRCHDRLVSEGVNLAAYNSAESAADLNDLRIALGYEEWNLFGTSYGTRLALTAMRDFPEGIRSVILDSTYPPQLNIYAELPVNLGRALDVFFEGCAADPACSQSYPDLEAVFWNLVDQLNESPITFPVTHAISGKTYDVLMNGNDLIGFLFQSLYSTEIVPLLPKIISEIQDGTYDTLAVLQGSQLANTEFVSTGMHYSVQCREEVSFSTPEELNEAYDAYPELQGIFYELANTDDGICATCQQWGAGKADPIENESVYSDIPTLILAGEYDPITPPQWGQTTAKTLENSYYYEFPGVGHSASVSREECPLNIALAFLDDPTVEPDVTTCISDMSGPDFMPSLPEDIALKPYTDQAFNVIVLIPKDWTQVSPGRFSPSKAGLTSILQQVVKDLPATTMLTILTFQIGLDEIPEKKDTRKTNHFIWSLYEFEHNGLLFDLAIADRINSHTDTLFILMQSLPHERDFYYEKVFLPTIDGFAYR